MYGMVILCLTLVIGAADARANIIDPYITSNQCSLYQGGCRYRLILARSNCVAQDDPTPEITTPGADVTPENNLVEQEAMKIKKLEKLEKKLVKMMEGLSIRSLRHIRQIRADLREMTASMNLLRMKARTGRELQYRSENTQCPPEFVGVGTWTSCYRFSTFNSSWHDAREYCSAFGANLVALETLKETYILDYLIKSTQAYQAPKGWWTSGNYIARSRKWMWTSKHHLKDMVYSRWASSEPDASSSMHCMMLYKPENYFWHDATCSDMHNFICEIELV